MVRVPAPLLLVALAVAPSCEGDTLAARAELEVSPDRLDFGAVATGDARTLTVNLRNRSPTADLTFTSVSLAEGSSPAFSLGAVPTVLGPEATATLAVRYTADDGEADAGHLILESNSQSAARILIPLESAATAPAIRLVPDRLDMGNLPAGGRTARTLEVENRGLDTLHVTRASLRTIGFQGEACRNDGECRDGRCAASTTGPVCASDCASAACAMPWTCDMGHDLGARCVEGPAGAPLRTARGFTLPGDAASVAVPPGGRATIAVDYAPGLDDRGAVQLIVESNDPDRPFWIVPVFGRPDDLPPVAVAAPLPPVIPAPLPGTVVGVDGRASSDPEGGPLTYRWSFVRRPEGSRAVLASASSATTSFAVDLPGPYVVGLEVRDTGGLSSSNTAEVPVDVRPGSRLRLVLRWDRADADLDLHLVRPGAAVGSVGDCYYDNATPDWPPTGPAGDPALTGGAGEESISIAAPADGTYTAVVTVADASRRGATSAVVSIEYESVEVARFETTLAAPATAWDVATLSRPTGRVTALGTLR